MSRPRAFQIALSLPAVAAAVALCLLGCGRALPEEARISRVIDGDTVQLFDGRMVRYLGIDTPEVRRRDGTRWVVDPEPLGPEASALNRELVKGKVVRFEYDAQTHDRFGRLLAYVYVSDGGGGEIMVNAELLRAGLAELLIIPPNKKYSTELRALERKAQRAGRGVWGGR